MLFTVPLSPGTVLANVVWIWYVNGAPTAPSAAGTSQPSSNFPVFRVDTGTTAPSGAEEFILYDSTDLTNWNTGGYRINQIVTQLAGASNLYLANPWVATSQPVVIAPASTAQRSICRCYGTWNSISSISVDGVPMTITLVAVDDTNPDLVYNLNTTTLKNTETGLLIAERITELTIVAGQLQNVNLNQFVDLTRTDFISGKPTGTSLQYLLTCESLGAPMSLVLISTDSPVSAPNPILFKLDTSTIGLSAAGTFDLSKKAVA